MEVVVLSITNAEDENDGMDESCISRLERLAKFGGDLDIRVADGFLPKYRAWYLPRSPLGLTSGAAPLGSFS